MNSSQLSKSNISLCLFLSPSVLRYLSDIIETLPFLIVLILSSKLLDFARFMNSSFDVFLYSFGFSFSILSDHCQIIGGLLIILDIIDLLTIRRD
jgi:hypothetical protein